MTISSLTIKTREGEGDKAKSSPKSREMNDLASLSPLEILRSNTGVSREIEGSNREVTEKRNRILDIIMSENTKQENKPGRPVVLKGELNPAETINRDILPADLKDSYHKACTQDYGTYPNHMKNVRMAFFILQNGICSFCNKSIPSYKEAALDHNHFTKKIRGMAHNECNLLIGFIEKFLIRNEINIDELVIIYKEKINACPKS